MYGCLKVGKDPLRVEEGGKEIQPVGRYHRP